MKLLKIYKIIKILNIPYIRITLSHKIFIRNRIALSMEIYHDFESIEFQMDDSDGEDYEISVSPEELIGEEVFLTTNSYYNFIVGILEKKGFEL